MARLRGRKSGLMVMLALTMVFTVVTLSDSRAEAFGSFWDDDGSPHESYIEAIAAVEITKGCGNGAYCPDAPVTRAQMASFLVRALGLTVTDGATFTDISGHPHQADIEKLGAAGITNGCGNGAYCPDAAVSRAEMATFLARALELAPGTGNTFSDDDGMAHESNIEAMAAAGVTNGCGSGLYCPWDAVTRAQMASFLARGFGLEPISPVSAGGDDLYCTSDGLNRMVRSGERPPACWRPYGLSSPFNRPLPVEPRLHPRSGQIVARTLSLGPIVHSVSAPDSSSDWYHPIYFSTAEDPVYVVECTNPDWGRCEIEGMRVHIPSEARAAGGGDAHLSVIEQHTGWEYDLWKVSDKPSGGGTIRAEWGGRTAIDGQGLGSDATAAHFGLAAGVVRPEELAAGEINHALFLMVGCAAEEPVAPATGRGSICSDPTDAPAIGQLFWLDMTDAEIEALDVPPWKETILRAMARYGGYVGDTGGNEAFSISFESPSSFTSFGFADPWRLFLGQGDVSESGGKIYFDIANGVDWAGRLRIVDVCHGSGTC